MNKIYGTLKCLIRVVFLIIFIFCLASCGTENAADDKLPEDNTAVGEQLDITKDFVIVRGDTADTVTVHAAVTLKKALEGIFSENMLITTDWEKNPTYEHEFIIGETLRETADTFQADRVELGKNGYVVKEYNGKVFIAGGSPEGTAIGVQYFVDTFVKSNEIKLPTDYEHKVLQQYDIPSLYICYNNAKTYKISCTIENEDAKAAAELLQNSLYEKAGLWLEITYGIPSEPGSAFILDSTPLDTAGIIKVETKDGNLVFASSAKDGLYSCVDSFVSLYIKDAFGSYNFGDTFQYIDLNDYIVIN